MSGTKGKRIDSQEIHVNNYTHLLYTPKNRKRSKEKQEKKKDVW